VNLKAIESFFDNLFETAGNIALAFIRRAAPFAVPMAPAYFFGHAIYTAVDRNDWLAITVGVIAALGLESAGILAAHYAVKFYSDGRNRQGHAATIGTVLYLVIGIAAIWLMESATNDAKLVGTAMFLIAGIVYLLIGLSEADRLAQRTQETAENRNLAQETDEREWQRKIALAQMRLRHEEKLARIQAKSTIPAPQPSQNSQPTPQPATLYECACGKVYERPNSYSAHTRHCEVHKRVSANGQVKGGE
jgi:hypothetical protein